MIFGRRDERRWNSILPSVTDGDGLKCLINHQFGKGLDIQFISDDGKTFWRPKERLEPIGMMNGSKWEEERELPNWH